MRGRSLKSDFNYLLNEMPLYAAFFVFLCCYEYEWVSYFIALNT